MARVLYVTSVLPWPVQRNGGGRRTALIRRALVELGHHVDTLAVVPEGVVEPDAIARAQEAGVLQVVAVQDADLKASRLPGPLGRLAQLRKRFSSRYAPDARASDVVRRHLASGDYDLVVVRYGWTLAKCGLPLDAPPTVLDFDDVDWHALASKFGDQPWPGWSGRLGMRIALTTTRGALEPRARRCVARWVACAEDAEALAAEGMQADALPNIPAEADGDAPDPLPPEDGLPIVLFVGDLQHGPNASGLERFVTSIWPQVHRELPSATFRIVGRGMSEGQRTSWSAVPGVEPIGFAEDVRNEYQRASVAVAPCWWGGGTKIKVVEAAALGRAQVTTTAALRGFRPLAEGAGDIGPALMLADDDAAFAAAVVRLLEEDGLRRAYAAAGPRHVAANYGFSAFRDRVARTVAGVASATGR